MPSADESLDLESNFSQIALELFEPGTVLHTLQQIVDLAERTVEGCDAAGIFLVEADKATTAAASGPLVAVIDDLQIKSGEGPCLDALSGFSTFHAVDLADDVRWPHFAPEAVAAGVRSILAYSLSADRPSALNLYAHMPAAFGVTDRAQGHLFATLARLALETAEERAADGKRTSNLTEALRTRELIGQAQGILMERERITADQAFEVLRKASQKMNVKLRDVAANLVETGEAPD